MNVHAVTVGPKGKITIPKVYREEYHLLEGIKAIMLPTEEGILIKRKAVSLRGIFAGKIDTTGFETDIRTLRKEWVQ